MTKSRKESLSIREKENPRIWRFLHYEEWILKNKDIFFGMQTLESHGSSGFQHNIMFEAFDGVIDTPMKLECDISNILSGT